MNRLTVLQRATVLVLGVVAVVAALVWVGSGGSSERGASRHPASTSPSPHGRSAFIDESRLPAQARQTIKRIKAGGPFPYGHDGSVFANRRRLLPVEPSGFYHEYAVGTPGSEDRGARAIVQGSGGRLYWSDDHYRSFRQIRRD